MTKEQVTRGEQGRESRVHLQRALDLFASNYRARNLSGETVAWYEKRLGHFIEWYLAEFGCQPTIQDLNPQTFQLFILEKQTKGVFQNHPVHKAQERLPSSSYIHGYYRAVRAFGKWLAKQHLMAEDPMAGLELPKLEEKQLQPLTQEEERRLLEAYSENSRSGCRIKAILMLMLHAGLRRSEVTSLKYEHVNLEEGFLLVRGKGRKERWVPFGYKTGWVLQRYAMLCRPDPATAQVDTFFLDPEGYSMTTNALKMIFERAKRKANIPRLHPHLLRHTYGIRSQEMSMPSLTLQRYMGHSDVRTTERYAHAAQSEKIKRERGYSHLDQLDIKVKRNIRGRRG